MSQGQWAGQATANAAGQAVVPFGPKARDVTWSVGQVSVECPAAPIGSTCEWRDYNGWLVSYLAAAGDVAGNGPPLPIPGGHPSTITWKGLPPGTVGKVLVIYDDGR